MYNGTGPLSRSTPPLLSTATGKGRIVTGTIESFLV